MNTWWNRPIVRYHAVLFFSLACYSAALVVSLQWLHAPSLGHWKYAIALLPVLPALGIPFAAVQLFQSMDELQRRIQLESLAFGFALAAITTFTYGFLQNAGLPEVSWIWV